MSGTVRESGALRETDRAGERKRGGRDRGGDAAPEGEALAAMNRRMRLCKTSKCVVTRSCGAQTRGLHT